MTVTVRRANESDRSRCLELIEALTRQSANADWDRTFTALLEGERGEILVAEENGAVLGTATVSYNLAIRYGGEYSQLEELIVDPHARGKNVGGLLLESTIEHSRARGCAAMGLYLIERTETNRPFYEKYGFEKVGSELRQDLEGDPE